MLIAAVQWHYRRALRNLRSRAALFLPHNAVELEVVSCCVK